LETKVNIPDFGRIVQFGSIIFALFETVKTTKADLPLLHGMTNLVLLDFTLLSIATENRWFVSFASSID
jgi:hypothetical protein